MMQMKPGVILPDRGVHFILAGDMSGALPSPHLRTENKNKDKTCRFILAKFALGSRQKIQTECLIQISFGEGLMIAVPCDWGIF